MTISENLMRHHLISNYHPVLHSKRFCRQKNYHLLSGAEKCGRENMICMYYMIHQDDGDADVFGK